MAEQAINTIYLLGEQPDALCSDLIKNLTAKTFDAPGPSTHPLVELDGAPSTPTKRSTETDAPTPRTEASPIKGDAEDMGGAFVLAQLVFAVGHVAIKEIVYLELVEREFKRRKDEKAKGA